jgi:hypothetical protein
VTVRVAVTVPPLVAEMVTLLEKSRTVRVVIVKVVLEFPAATVTLAGTEATDVLLLERVTTVPPAGAGALRVTVPVDGVPPLTLEGFRVNELAASVATVSDAVFVIVPFLAVIVTVALDASVDVVIVKVAVLAPAGTVTLAGTCAADVLLLESVTTKPPGGAAPVRVTVPVDDAGPTTEAGFRVRVDSAAGVTVSVAVLATP